MRMLTLGLIFLSSVAQAQWGTGVNMGNDCPSDYSPAPAAVNRRDNVSNLEGRRSRTQSALNREKARLSSVTKFISNDKKQMRGVLTSGAVSAVEYHQEAKNGPGDYSSDCSGASVGGDDSNVQQTIDQKQGANESGTAHTGKQPASDAFCSNGKSYFHYYAEDDGRVSESICEDNYAKIQKPRVSPAKRESCRKGLRRFYEDSEKKLEIQARVDELQAELEDADRQMEREQYDLDRRSDGDDYTEASASCADGSCGRTGYRSNNGVMSFLGALAPALIQGGLQYYQNKQENKLMKRAIDRTTELGWPVYGNQFNQIRRNIGGRGNPGWASNPMASIIPGFLGVHNGTYGAAPGGIGRGAFNCGGNGFNPLAMNQQAPGTLPFQMPGQGGPFGNPSLQQPFQNGFNQGGGPWGQNGQGQGYDPFASLNSQMFQPFYGQNPNAPGILPTQGQGNGVFPGQGSWYDQFNQYPNNGYGQGGPGGFYAPGGPGYNQSPGYGPGYGQGFGYGGPGGYYGPGGPGYDGYGYGGGFSGILNGLNYDLYSMGYKLNLLQTGGYSGNGYGGGNGGGAPAILPFPGPGVSTGNSPYYGGFLTNPTNTGGSPAIPGAPPVPR